MKDLFEIAGGSVTGADHIMIGKPGSKNNQDAYTWRKGSKVICAVVCDGCSSGRYSEVGAHIGAEVTAQAVWELASFYDFGEAPAFKSGDARFWEELKKRIIGTLGFLSKKMGYSLSQTVNDYFLFSIVGCLMTEEYAYIFSCGDGVYSINGEMTNLGPFPNNSPPYIAYNMTGTTLLKLEPELLDFQVQKVPTAGIQDVILGTDGVLSIVKLAEQDLPRRDEKIGGLDQFLENKYFINPDNVRRRLNIINKEDAGNGRLLPGPLKDDATLIVIRRKKQAEPEKT
jgi:hypothetical protein